MHISIWKQKIENKNLYKHILQINTKASSYYMNFLVGLIGPVDINKIEQIFSKIISFVMKVILKYIHQM